MKRKTAIGYCRTDKNGPAYLNVEYQRGELRDLCKQKGFRLLKIATDEESGGNSVIARPGALAVLKAVHSRAVDCVVIWDAARMTTDDLQHMEFVNLLVEKGMEYWSVIEGQLADSKFPLDDFVDYLAVHDSQARRLIAERTKLAIQRKQERGERVGRAPYGWMYEYRRLVPNPAEQKMIRRIHRLRHNGTSLRTICKTLWNERYRTRVGTKVSTSQIVSILRRPRSTGE